MDENIVHGAPQVGVSRQSFFEKLSFGILLVFTLLVPIFFIPASFLSTQFGTSLLFAFAVIISLLAFIVTKFQQGSVEIPRSGFQFVTLIGLIPLVYTLSSFVDGISRMKILGYTFDVSTVGFMVLSFVFMFLVMLLFRNKERMFYSYMAVVIASIISALFVIIRLIFGANVLSFGIFTTITATVLGSWSSLGIFFGIAAILSAITLEMLSLHKMVKTLVALALLLSLFFVAIVNFSLIWIAIGMVSLLYIIYSMFSGPRFVPKTWKQRIMQTPRYLLVVFVVACIFTFSSFGGKLSDSLHISNIEVRPGVSTTFDIFKNTIQNHPLFGSGPNTFALQWMSYKPASVNTTVFWNTDFAYGVGLLPTLAITTGLFGTLSWIIFFVLFIYLGCKALFAEETDNFSKYLLVSSLFVSVYLWVMNCLYVPGIVVCILTFFFSGLALSRMSERGLIPMKTVLFGGKTMKGFLTSFVLVFVGVCAIALGYGLMNNSISLWHFQKGIVAGNAGDATTALQEVITAEKYVPYDVYYRAESEIAQAQISSLLSQDLSKADVTKVGQAFQTYLGAAVTAAEKAKAADKTNYLNWIEAGRAYSLAVPSQTKVAGAYEQAKVAYLEAQKINPQNPTINLLLAQLDAANGSNATAEQYAILSINQKPDYLDAYFLLSQLQVSDKNIQGAINSVSAAAQVDPTNPSIFFQLGLLYYNLPDYKTAILAFEKSLSLAPDYANAKYFLGLSLAKTGDLQSALLVFQDLAKTNPDNADVKFVLSNLQAGKSPFANAVPPVNPSPEKGTTLPIKEKNQ